MNKLDYNILIGKINFINMMITELKNKLDDTINKNKKFEKKINDYLLNSDDIDDTLQIFYDKIEHLLNSKFEKKDNNMVNNDCKNNYTFKIEFDQKNKILKDENIKLKTEIDKLNDDIKYQKSLSNDWERLNSLNLNRNNELSKINFELEFENKKLKNQNADLKDENIRLKISNSDSDSD